MKSKNDSLLTKDGVSYVLPFILITLCFALWGFACGITNPMVITFSKIFRMSVTDGTLIQVAYNGGYFAMAFPAAMFIRKYSYKAGILMGLSLYAFGAFMFLPAKLTGEYFPFLGAYFILTCGLSFLETSANPYIVSMGDESTGTRRLNLAQSFNPLGLLAGMFVAMDFIQARISPLDNAQRDALNESEYEAIKHFDLDILIKPYLVIGAILLAIFLVIRLVKMPKNSGESHRIDFWPTLRRIFSIRHYRNGVITQFFTVGAQMMCWTFILQYGTRIFTAQGMSEQVAEVLSQKYNIYAILLFSVSRFVCTYLLKYFKAGSLVAVFASTAVVLTSGVICFQGIWGLYCLVGISACMSLMFPTIYGLALSGLGEDSKFGAAGLIMSILGGSVLPPLQAMIIDKGTIAGLPAVNLSFTLTLVCFVIIARFGLSRRKA